MRTAARAIVTRGNEMLVMKRKKFTSEYYVLVGGEVDPGETPEQAVVREVQEETQLDIINPRLVYIEEAGQPFGTQYIYLAELAKDGEPMLHPDAPEHVVDAMGNSLHYPMWVKTSELEKLPFRSQTLKESLLDAFKKGFPNQPETIIPREDIRYTE